MTKPAVRGARSATLPHRWTGGLAIATPAIMWTAFIVIALQRPQYDILTRAASDLGARGTPNAELFTIGYFFAGGLLTILVGIGLHGLHGGRRTWKAGAALVTVAGGLLFITGAFPNAGAGQTAGRVHSVLSQTCFTLIAIAPLVLIIDAPDGVPVRLRRLWLVSALAAPAIEVGDIALGRFIRIPDGVFQRPFLFSLTVWFVATGVWLIRHEGTHSS